MANMRTGMIWVATAVLAAAAEPALDEAEVRLPYAELRRLIERADGAGGGEAAPEAELLSARFRLGGDAGGPVVDAGFRVVRWAAGPVPVPVPLVGGAVALERHEPADAALVVRDGMICHGGAALGTATVDARLVVAAAGDEFELVVPPCASAVVEVGGAGDDIGAVVRGGGGTERVLGPGGRIVLPAGGATLTVRWLSGERAREALRPPAPSAWRWQHQVLVVPGVGELDYRVAGHASAAGGSGTEATLVLPAEARGVEVGGDDLASQRVVRGADGVPRLHLGWSARGVLERDVAIRYRVPLRPLDETWELAAPAGEADEATRAVFAVVASPRLGYAADGLVGPLPPEALPAVFSGAPAAGAFYQLESGARAVLAVRRLPVVATAEAIAPEAAWVLRVEPDGALLAEGKLQVEHRGEQRVVLETPEGMALLTGQVGDRAFEPVDLGDGRLEFALPAPPAGGPPTVLACSFTGRTEPLDPVEGTLALSLPRTPLFIRALTWRVELPPGLRAEVHGNVTREPNPAADGPATLHLRKNLCRDEQPGVRVFYQRADLMP